MNPRWHDALAYALVGEGFGYASGPTPHLERLILDLAESGWTSERIADHARCVVSEALPWPHPVPTSLRDGCGAAQFHAAVDRLRALLDLATMEKRPPSGRRRLNPDEERLMREVPPHHGP